MKKLLLIGLLVVVAGVAFSQDQDYGVSISYDRFTPILLQQQEFTEEFLQALIPAISRNPNVQFVSVNNFDVGSYGSPNNHIPEFRVELTLADLSRGFLAQVAVYAPLERSDDSSLLLHFTSPRFRTFTTPNDSDISTVAMQLAQEISSDVIPTLFETYTLQNETEEEE